MTDESITLPAGNYSFTNAFTTCLTIMGGSTPVMRFDNDGTLWVNPDIPPTDAAQAVIDALRPMLLSLYASVRP